MSERSKQAAGWRRKLGIAGGAILAAILVGFAARSMIYPYAVGQEQPLPFSHRIHAGVREISCFFCHDGADRSSNAGMPEVRKCVLCHNVIIRELPPIQKLHDYYNRKEPIPWVRVNLLPDYAQFKHQMHLAAGIDCRECHGHVKAMDRILPYSDFHMGFCIDCHRKHRASVDCLTCHY